MKHLKSLISIALVLFLIAQPAFSQRGRRGRTETPPPQEASNVSDSYFNALRWRLIGPATVSGRISDIAVNPEDHSEYYVATASGGLWKTENNGTTFDPIFDNQPVYSFGALAIDPCNPNVVWAGTGENNSQRNLAYGDGVYKSLDAGKTWKNMGLKKSEHIGKIMIDPSNTDVVYVASQGPAWGPGGERGLYKTTDGGENWELVLDTGNEYTGASDMEMDPRNPDILYVSTHQRERRVWSKINGGPHSAIYKSTDAGKTWKKLKRGLPGGEVGRIGLTLSPANPDVLYAVIELPGSKGGFYRSDDMGESWSRKSDMVPGSPQYYNELYADNLDENRVVSMDVYNRVTNDGGVTWSALGERNKHVDNHAMWQDPDDPGHYIMGCDGGMYESWDMGANWIFKSNLPITQYYHVRVDNDYPFYNLYGGAQDNGSWYGPSRTHRGYMTNNDYTYTIGGDGYLSIPDPTNPAISYHESQYCGLRRYDENTGTSVSIKPQPKNDVTLKFNWNTPYFISPHNPKTLYVAAQYVFKSTDMGGTWEQISGDLTRQIDQNDLPMMGKIWPPEAIAKNLSTSPFGNIFSLEESPLKKGMIYAGTDDGLIWRTDDDGANWTRFSSFPGVPDMTFVNYVLPSRHNENTVYAVFDGRKNASDFTPYVIKSTDKGQTWTSIASNLPSGTVYVIREDHVDPDILFIGTEWGVYVTVNGGQKWVKLRNGMPTIQVKDLAIQERENDLAAATFGRGWYVLEDYSYLRDIKDAELFNKPAHIFPIKDGLEYFTASNHGGQGELYWRNRNPRPAVTFTYYVRDGFTSLESQRKAEERKQTQAGQEITYPEQEALFAEDEEESPYLMFIIKNAEGEIMSKMKQSVRKGLSRTSWNMNYGAGYGGFFVPPGTYNVSIVKWEKGEKTELAGPVDFEVKALENTGLGAPAYQQKFNFLKEAADLYAAVNSTNTVAREIRTNLESVEQTLLAAPMDHTELVNKVKALDKQLFDLVTELSGRPLRSPRADSYPPSIRNRASFAISATSRSFDDITGAQREEYAKAKEQFDPLFVKFKEINEELWPALKRELDAAGVPWTQGRDPQY